MKKFKLSLIILIISIFLIPLLYLGGFFVLGFIADTISCHSNIECNKDEICGTAKTIGFIGSCSDMEPCVTFRNCVKFPCNLGDIIAECGIGDEVEHGCFTEEEIQEIERTGISCKRSNE
ncbi:hypothetical protein KJ751_00890 [Patescibacteria group bacterium]|nr:hypothetical protein [Patescibacteria group bacterium]